MCQDSTKMTIQQIQLPFARRTKGTNGSNRIVFAGFVLTKNVICTQCGFGQCMAISIDSIQVCM